MIRERDLHANEALAGALPARGLVATRQSLRSLAAKSPGSAADRAQQRAWSRWDNEGGAIPR